MCADRFGNIVRRTWYSDDCKRNIYSQILAANGNGRLKRGLPKRLAQLLHVSPRSLRRIWNTGQTLHGVNSVINKKAKNYGRKRVEIDTAMMEAIPLGERTTICDLSASMHMKSTTVFKRLKEKKIRRHSNALKPDLTHENMKERVRYCLS